MKSIGYFLILVWSFSVVGQHQDKIRIKSERVRTYITLKKEVVDTNAIPHGGSFVSRQAHYDNAEINWFHSAGFTKANFVRIYDSVGNLTKEKWYFDEKHDEVLHDYQYSYDYKRNRIQERQKIDFLETEDVIHFFYDENNLLIYKFDTRLAKPEPSTLTNYKYDANRNLIEIDMTSGYGYHTLELFRYNERNQKIEHATQEIDPNNDSKPIVWETYTWDNARNLLAEKIAWNPNIPLRFDPKVNTVYTYDENARVIREGNKFREITYEYYKDGTLKKIMKEDLFNKHYEQLTYEYNADKTVRKLQIKTDKKTRSAKFSYKYDSHGNWIEQEKVIDGNVFRRTRELVYF